VVLVAVAERTSRIRLAAAVVAVTLKDPRRLAKDAAVLDVQSGGRLKLEGRGRAYEEASWAWGRDHGPRYADAAAAVDELIELLGGSASCPPRRMRSRAERGRRGLRHDLGQRRSAGRGARSARFGSSCSWVPPAGSSRAIRDEGSRLA
jgi:alkanesulfonate monooxygenase SsuD/methylene tetrahydromethanopterin reductase-like flavin-dependent oxidoreductase (luciferase family)